MTHISACSPQYLTEFPLRKYIKEKGTLPIEDIIIIARQLFTFLAENLDMLYDLRSHQVLYNPETRQISTPLTELSFESSNDNIYALGQLLFGCFTTYFEAAFDHVAVNKQDYFQIVSNKKKIRMILERFLIL